MAPEVVINARKQQNLYDVPLGDALKNSARDAIGSLATTKYFDPRSDVKWGDRTIGLLQQLGLLHQAYGLGKSGWDAYRGPRDPGGGVRPIKRNPVLKSRVSMAAFMDRDQLFGVDFLAVCISH